MQAILSLCGNRCVLFNNKTKDEKKQSDQVQQLLSFVNMVVSQNGGQPYRDELFKELKVEVLQSSTISFLKYLKNIMIPMNSSFHCRKDKWSWKNNKERLIP